MDCEYMATIHYIDTDEIKYECINPNHCFQNCSSNPDPKHRLKTSVENKKSMDGEKIMLCPCGKIPAYTYYKLPDRDEKQEYVFVACSDPECKKIQSLAAFPTVKMAEDYWNKEVQKYNFNENLSKKLSPCLCGGPAKIFTEDIAGFYLWYIRCDKCGKTLTTNPEPYKLIERWNNLAARKGKDTDDME